MPNPGKLAEEERERFLQKKMEAYEKARNYSLQNRTVQRYRYVVIEGNNSKVIRTCMELRSDRWEETSSFDKIFNFKWQPVSRGINYETTNSFGTRQLVNHI